MSILASILETRRRRQAIRDLRAMPSELLLDIGIEPDQIEKAVSALGRPTSRPAGPAHAAASLSRTPWPYI